MRIKCELSGTSADCFSLRAGLALVRLSRALPLTVCELVQTNISWRLRERDRMVAHPKSRPAGRARFLPVPARPGKPARQGFESRTGGVPALAQQGMQGSALTRLALLFGLLAVLIALPAKAQMTVADLQIAARALSFMERPLSGTVRMGIMYIPGDPASEAEAESAVQLLGSGLKAGNLLFAPVRVAVKDAGTAVVDLFFLPDGMGDRSAPVAAAAEKRKLVCVTLDISQVEKGACVLGVQSKPKVRIFVSRSAAIASKSTFVTVFLMMVSEI